MNLPAIFLLSVLILCLRLENIQAQQYSFQSYSTLQGLPQSEIYSLLQDRRKNIWLATNGGGICRFNGKTFQIFNQKIGLIDDQTRHLFEDSRGNLWIATPRGLSCYDGKKFVNYAKKEGFEPKGGNIFITEDKAGVIWVFAGSSFNKMSNGQVFYFQKGRFWDLSGKFPQLKEPDKVQGIFRNKQGIIWINTNEGVFSYEQGKSNPLTINSLPQLKGKIIIPLLEDSKGRLWLKVNAQTNRDGKLYYWQNQQLHSFEIATDIAQIKYIREDRKGRLWFASIRSGTFCYDGTKILALHQNNGLLSNEIEDILEDYEGNIWLGMAGNGGLARFNEEKFIGFQQKDGLDNNAVWTIFQDSKKQIWFGTSGKGSLTVWDGTKIKNFPVSDNIELSRVTKIVEQSNGNFLLSTYKGLFEFDGQHFREVSTEYGIPKGTRLSSILSTSQGIWITSYGEGLFFVGEGQKKHYTKENSPLADNLLNYIYQDYQGVIWLCASKGLIRFDGKNFKIFNLEDGLSHEFTIQIIEDHLKRLWIATYGGGISIFDGKKFTTISTKDGINSGIVYNIQKDRQNNIWLGVQSGIDKIALTEKGQIRQIKHFAREDGFLGTESNVRANLTDESGNLWFGTIEGAIRYNPHLDEFNTYSPLIQFTSIKLFLKDINWESIDNQPFSKKTNHWFPIPQNLNLPHNQNNITFNFEALYYTAPEKIRYQYKLAGFDQQWSPLSAKSEAEYTNLPAGTYTFMVKAVHNEGIASPKPLTYTFTIQTPFWQTWWFYIVFSLASLSAVGLLTRYYLIWRFKQKLKALRLKHQVQLERERISRDLHDNIGSQLTYIVASLDEILEANPEAIHHPRIEEINEFARKTYYELRETVWAIQEERLHLEDLILKIQRLAQQCLRNKITYHFEKKLQILENQFINAKQALNIYRITQEALTNVLKYSQATNLNIQISLSTDHILSLYIQDNGVGFEPNQVQAHLHYGIQGMKKRAEEIQADLEIKTDLLEGVTIILSLKI